MYINQSDFYGEVTLKDADSIPGFGDLIDEVESEYLRMILGNEQYQNMYDALLDENSADYAKWNEFLNGGVRYTKGDTKITYYGARRFLRYFCWIALIDQQPISAGNEIYKQEITSAQPLEGIDRQHKINSVFNKGVKFFERCYWYMVNSEDYTFDTACAVFPKRKTSFGGLTL